MYVDASTRTVNGKKYTRHLLRESYREKGKGGAFAISR